MSTVILYSGNLKPNSPKADILVRVAKEDDIYKTVAQLAAAIQSGMQHIAPGCFNDLVIVCDSNSNGLELGSGINAQNINAVFAPLKYKIGNVSINGCDAASNYYEGNNGMQMCRRLAQATYANVRASNNNAAFTERTDVVTWNQRGHIIMLNRYEHGELTATYDHPGQLLVHELKRSYKELQTKQKQAFLSTPFLKRSFILFYNILTHFSYRRFLKHAFARSKMSNTLPKK